MKRLSLMTTLLIAIAAVGCKSPDPVLDPTLPGAIDDGPSGIASTPFGGDNIASPAPDGSPTPTPAASGSATPKPAASGAGSGTPDDGDENEPIGNVSVFEAPASHQGEAAFQLNVQLPLNSQLPGTRELGSARVVLKRDGVIFNATMADTTIEAERIVDQVAGVQVNHCEAGSYILQVEAFDTDGKSLGKAESQFKLEAGGTRAMDALMAYAIVGTATSLKVTLSETRAFYVQGGTPSAMTVMWSGSASATAKVGLYDDKGVYVTNKTATASTRHQLRFTGLTAGTTYQYVAYEGTTEVGRGKFRTNDPEGVAKFRFAGLGDTGQGSVGQFAIARRLAAWKPAFVVHAGDVIYPSGAASAYGPYFVTPYRELIASTVFYPSLGNHDYRTNKGQPYLDFFEAPRATTDDNERYYTFRYGNAQFFALDTNQAYGTGSAQRTWLESELKDSTATWKIPFFHHPPYSSGEHGSDTAVRTAFAPLFEKYGVKLVLTGHDHHYERTKPQNGVTYVVTGGGGAELRDVKPSAFTALAASRLEFAGVTIEGKKLVLEAIDDKGNAFDSTTLTVD